jgi:hypothetical protein
MMKTWQKMLGLVATTAGAALLATSASAQTNCNLAVGPDVIVGDLTGPTNYGASNGGTIEALSLGTTSCNIGTVWLNWIENTNQHPVIGGALWRYRSTAGVARYEQVGQSWLKHGFFALSQNLCCSGCQSTNGTHLGVHCSDPYTSARNGTQGGLGPRWQVNANTGFYNYPPAGGTGFSGSTARRLEVEVADLAASDRYFGECVYVSPDDAAAGNQDNNASYREVSVSGSGSTWNFGFVGATQREKEAPLAWKAIDPSLNQSFLSTPGEGAVMILSSKVTSLGGGLYDYEYLVYNQNSDLSAGSFSIPIPAGVNVSNIGFHDVAYRNGDGPGNVNFDGTDWAGSVSGGNLTWATQTFAQNQSANAIRWQTGYNFRFVADAAPTTGNVTIGLFKNGSSFATTSDVPSGTVDAGTPFCTGDGSDPQVTNLCPCFNLGTTGRGCDNSAGTGGALLSATGTTSPDTVVLTSSGELNTSTSVFLQGTVDNVSGVSFGDGVRCVGGSLKRLSTKNAAGGTVTFPDGGDPSITTQSAALGDPIAPGSTRYYQVYYRDPNLAFCASPTGDSFNVSNGQIIVW